MPQEFGFPTFYSIYFPGKTMPFFHGPLYQARKQFFEEQRASRFRGSAYIAGLETVYAGALGRKRLKSGNCDPEKLPWKRLTRKKRI